MAKQGISTGTTPNDGAGDTLLSGAEKIISNFDEIYTLLGDGNNLSSGVVNSIIAGSGISISNSSGDVTVNNTGIAQTANIKSDTVESDTIVVSGISTFTGNIFANKNISLPDSPSAASGRLNFGDATDLRLFHDGTTNWIQSYGLLNLQSLGVTITSWNDLEKLADFNVNDSVDLYYDGVKKFETTGTGVTISGTTQTQQLNVSGVSTFTGATNFNDSILVRNITPTVDSNWSLGTTTFRWGTVYSDQFIGDGVTVTGNVQAGNVQVGSGQSFSSSTGSPAVYYGDGSQLTGITASGTGIIIKHDGSIVGTAGTIDFSTNLDVSAISAGIVTVTASGSGGGSSGFAEVAGIATYTSEWSLGADGINNYTFTGPGLTGAESDPPIYLTRGQQYKFTNNMNAHPFRIQSTANGSTGTQYNDGILANDVSNGTLTWDVQFDAPNELYYQCTAHPNMGGKIHIVPRTEPAVGSRSVVSATTGSVSVGATTNLDLSGFKSYGLLKVGISSAAWVRLYVDAASRTSDSSRSYLVDPSPGSGLIAEVRSVSTGSTSFLMTPGVIGWNNNVPSETTIYSAITNNESVPSTITVDLTVVKLED